MENTKKLWKTMENEIFKGKAMENKRFFQFSMKKHWKTKENNVFHTKSCGKQVKTK